MKLKQAIAAVSEAHGLTPRQHEVLSMIYHAKTPEQIAEKLGLSVNTSHNHRKDIYKRMGVSSVAELFHVLLKVLLKGAE